MTPCGVMMVPARALPSVPSREKEKEFIKIHQKKNDGSIVKNRKLRNYLGNFARFTFQETIIF